MDLGFQQAVASGGYRWWYLDALSDDGRNGITLIAFIGSVFSPYYAWKRRRGDPQARDHCALNVCLYGPPRKRWAMTERGRSALHTDARTLTIGPSALRWDGDTLTVDLDEVSVPLPARVRGTVRLHPLAVNPQSQALDSAQRHRWWPVAPRARVEVAMVQPSLHWSGIGYLDSNEGDEPLEQGFAAWDWSRTTQRDATTVLYDGIRRGGDRFSLALRFGDSDHGEPLEPPPTAPLPSTGWRIRRAIRADPGHDARVVETLEDTPFYARSLVYTWLLGRPVTAIHESLSLDRFSAPWVQLMLPFRMPRRGG